jgi:hypothetical protein
MPDDAQTAEAPDDVQLPVPAERGAVPPVSQPTKLIRIASMTRAMLDEVRQAPLDDAGRRRLLEIHERTLTELREILSPELLDEFDEMFLPIRNEVPSESELRVAQAQLVGWLEGVFHGIQASLWSQQAAAQAQLQQLRQQRALQGPAETDDDQRSYPGVYL